MDAQRCGQPGQQQGRRDAFFELGAYSFDMLAPGVIFLDGDGPADPLVARERRYVFPGQQGLGVGCKRFSEIGGEGIDDAGGDSRVAMEFSLWLENYRSEMRVRGEFRNCRR